MTSALRCLQTLELMAEAPFELGVTELASRLSIAKTTAHRVLDALCRAGFARRDPVNRRYRLSGKALWVGAGVLRNSTLYSCSFILMEQLAMTVDGSVHLGIREGDSALYLHSVGFPTTMHLFAHVGDRRPLHATAIGKVLLAYGPLGDVQRIMRSGPEPWTTRTIISVTDMEHELQQVRQRGYATTSDELIPGISAIATAVRNRAGDVVAAIGIGTPTNRLTSERLTSYVESLGVAAAKISAQKGYRFAANHSGAGQAHHAKHPT
ncbi:MAG: IclR family transcriptional regulator [Bryobacteraceae bacterium]